MLMSHFKYIGRFNFINLEEVINYCESNIHKKAIRLFFFLFVVWVQVTLLDELPTHIITVFLNTVKPVYNDHLYSKIYYLWFIQ